MTKWSHILRDVELVFRALGDPSRRLLLDRLFQRDGQTLGDLCEGITMTRYGVMKHLRLLEQAGLVATRRAGREKLHYLNPVPLYEVYDRWIRKFERQRLGALRELKRKLEGDRDD